jgi:hypothetical protein
VFYKLLGKRSLRSIPRPGSCEAMAVPPPGTAGQFHLVLVAARWAAQPAIPPPSEPAASPLPTAMASAPSGTSESRRTESAPT